MRRGDLAGRRAYAFGHYFWRTNVKQTLTPHGPATSNRKHCNRMLRRVTPSWPNTIISYNRPHGNCHQVWPCLTRRGRFSQCHCLKRTKTASIWPKQTRTYRCYLFGIVLFFCVLDILFWVTRRTGTKMFGSSGRGTGIGGMVIWAGQIRWSSTACASIGQGKCGQEDNTLLLAM